MIRRLITYLLCVVSAISASGKVVLTGELTDADGNPAAGVIIRLYKDRAKSPVAFTTSDRAGKFRLAKDTLTFPVTLTFASSKYAAKEMTIEKDPGVLKVPLRREDFVLEEVTVQAPAARVKGDTIVYDVNSFKGKGDRSIEDVIKKLPGVTVDDSGKIYYDEEPINNFYIEGMNLMGGNYMIASQNISPDDISTISVYERHQPKKALKGIVDSKNAALNLKLKKGRMLKPIGYLRGGAGYGDRLLWDGNLYGMLVSPVNQTIVTAKGNNAGSPYVSVGNQDGEGRATKTFNKMPFGAPSISQSRFLDNRSGYFSANTLFKLPDETTLTVNSSYSLENDSYEGATITEYLLPGAPAVTYEEKASSALQAHRVSAGLKFEKNKDRLYLLDQLTFRGLFNDNRYLLHDAGRTEQTLYNHEFRVRNTFKTVVRRARKIYEVSSVTELKNTPVNHIGAVRFASEDASSSETVMGQTVKGLSFFNSESTGFSFQFGRRSQAGVELSFNAAYDRLRSLARGSEEEPVGDDRNDVSGYKIRTSATPYYRISFPGRFSAKLSVPVEMLDIRYVDALNGDVYSHHRPYLSPLLSVTYKANQRLVFDLDAGRRWTLGDIADFIDNPIYTTYRSITTMGTGSLRKERRDYVNLSTIYRDALAGLYLMASGSFSITENNTISVSDVGEDGSSVSSSRLNESNRSRSTMARFSASKRVYDWRTTFALSGTGQWRTRKRIRSGEKVDVNSSFYTLTGRVESSLFSGKVATNLSCVYSHVRQDFGGKMGAVGLNSVEFTGKVSVFPTDILEIYGDVSLNHAELATGGYKSNVFVDAGMRVKLRKFEIELAGKNLTNLRRYEYAIYSTLDIVNYNFRLRPIQGVLSLRYSF